MNQYKVKTEFSSKSYRFFGDDDGSDDDGGGDDDDDDSDKSIKSLVSYLV